MVSPGCADTIVVAQFIGLGGGIPALEDLVEEREKQFGSPFMSAEDLALRVPLLNKKELTLLARIGALNNLERVEHRRDALWQVERAGKMEGPLFRQKSEVLSDDTEVLPLHKMNTGGAIISC